MPRIPEHILRQVLNTFGHSPPMQSVTGPKSAQDEKVKSTLQEIAFRFGHQNFSR